MAYYLIFTADGKYTGYTKNKKHVRGMIEQRKKIQKLLVEKMDEDVFTEERKQDLYMSEGEVFDYYGTYLFEHEQDIVHTTCLREYEELHKSILGYMFYIRSIKFTDEENQVMGRFSKYLAHVGESIIDEFISSEEPYYHCFDIKRLAMKVLKDIYKVKKVK